MWVATVDFQKEFDSIQHVSMPYISLLKKLYDDQCATALTDVESAMCR